MTNLLCAISTMSFSLTMVGGRRFSNPGMVVVFFGIHNGSLCPTSKFHLMPLGHCVMVPFFSITNSFSAAQWENPAVRHLKTPYYHVPGLLSLSPSTLSLFFFYYLLSSYRKVKPYCRLTVAFSVPEFPMQAPTVLLNLDFP